MELSERLTVCARLLRNALGPIAAGRGLSDSQLSVLLACRYAPAGGLGQTELAVALAVSAALVSATVEQLRTKNLLRGRRAAPDRRRQLWQITAAGQKILDEVADELAAWAAAMDRRVASDDLARLRKTLDQLAGLLRHADPPADAPGLAEQRRAG